MLDRRMIFVSHYLFNVSFFRKLACQRIINPGITGHNIFDQYETSSSSVFAFRPSRFPGFLLRHLLLFPCRNLGGFLNTYRVASMRRCPLESAIVLIDSRSKYFPSPRPESTDESICWYRLEFNNSACDTACPFKGSIRQVSKHRKRKYMRFIIHLTVSQYHQNAVDTQT